MNKQENIPALRFPEFSGNWVVKKLGDVYSLKVTNSYSRDNLNYESGTVKNIHYGDIHSKFPTAFDITKEQVPFINAEINIQRIAEDNYCIEGDIIFADASEDLNDVGKSIEIVNLNNEKLLSGLHTILARQVGKELFVGFGGHLFKSNNIRLQIQKEAQGTKVLSISGGRLSNIFLTFPTLPEQQKIATFLSSVDEKLQGLKKKKSLLEAYKKGMMQRLFSSESGLTRLEDEQDLDDNNPTILTSRKLRFRQDNGEDFPEWEEKTLGEVCKIQTGNKDTQNREVNGKFPFFVRSNTVERINTYSFDGEAILTSGDGVGVGKNFHYIVGKFDFHQRVYALHSFEKCIYGKFIYFVFTEQFYQRVMRLSAKNSVDSIRMEMIAGMNIGLPTLPEQTKIANFLSAIDEKIAKVSQEIEQATVWKKGLLQQLFV